MNNGDGAVMREEIVAVIGRDAVYISAAEEVRHFDPISVVSLYAGQLLFGFLRSAGQSLWSILKEKAADTGKKAVGDAFDAALKKVEQAVAGPEAAAPTSAQAQAAQLDVAGQALKELSASIEDSYLESFLDAGESAVVQRLMQDNFSEAKARRIAAAVTLQIQKQLRGSGAAA